MKKYQYMVAVACLLVGTIGFASVYATNQSEQNKKELVQNQQLQEESQKAETDNEASKAKDNNNQVAGLDSDSSLEEQLMNDLDVEPEGTDVEVSDEDATNQDGSEQQDTAVGTVTEEVLHFNPEYVVWPVEGSVLLDYSMDATIFFPTLQQYQYHPAMVIDGEVNDKVYFVAKGKIVNIETNEVTGCTVTQDLGDGYTAIYGQLKELNFEVGDTVESGQVVGYISEPTKYYTVEGSNVYFQLLKDGLPVDPEEILP